MELTPENKAHIDALSHHQLLSRIRVAPSGDPWFQGDTGKYWMSRYAEKRDENPGEAVRDSKAIG
uniref:Uncharacterized protein n=1 Tax=viral metagenome TaxID=1070528 RepID=A0A6M3JGX5_9ZZZZ